MITHEKNFHFNTIVACDGNFLPQNNCCVIREFSSNLVAYRGNFHLKYVVAYEGNFI